MRKLLDLNVWMALAIDTHPQHTAARAWLDEATIPAGGLLFCLQTEMGLLRLLTQAGTMKAFGLAALTNTEALAFVRKTQSDPKVARVESPPPITREIWLRAAATKTPSPNVWMDAWLAAFAIALDAEMVTFDSGFENFTIHGLKLVLLVNLAP